MGSSKRVLIFCRMRKPSASPGPRNDCSEERFALSYDALNTRGILACAAISASRSAIMDACASLSITHGPAINTSGWFPPMRKFPIEISRAGCMEVSVNPQTRFIAYAGQPRFATGVIAMQRSDSDERTYPDLWPMRQHYITLANYP